VAALKRVTIDGAAMTKPPEEGKIWEWRAFGRIDDELSAKVYVYPIRLGVDNLLGEDVYLVSPLSDQNVKLRRCPSGWLLKFKLLVETRLGAFEQYKESAELSYPFPVSLDKLREAARLLAVELPAVSLATEKIGDEEFVEALAQSSPAALRTRVSKKRSQYQFDNGWIELADVEFRTRRIQSLSVNSPEFEVVEEMLLRLSPGEELEAMNYIEACRRWG
jgi:hypothetical protein